MEKAENLYHLRQRKNGLGLVRTKRLIKGKKEERKHLPALPDGTLGDLKRR
jgi:hypothetical protein